MIRATAGAQKKAAPESGLGVGVGARGVHQSPAGPPGRAPSTSPPDHARRPNGTTSGGGWRVERRRASCISQRRDVEAAGRRCLTNPTRTSDPWNIQIVFRTIASTNFATPAMCAHLASTRSASFLDDDGAGGRIRTSNGCWVELNHRLLDERSSALPTELQRASSPTFIARRAHPNPVDSVGGWAAASLPRRTSGAQTRGPAWSFTPQESPKKRPPSGRPRSRAHHGQTGLTTTTLIAPTPLRRRRPQGSRCRPGLPDTPPGT